MVLIILGYVIEKMFPVTVRLFDASFSRAMTKFFDINVMERKD